MTQRHHDNTIVDQGDDRRRTVNMGFRVTPERQRELQIAIALRGRSLQSLLEEGLEMALAASKDIAQAALQQLRD